MSTERRILLGRVAGAFGVRGELKLLSWTDPRDALFRYQPWILRSADGEREVSGVRGRDTGKLVIATFPGVDFSGTSPNHLVVVVPDGCGGILADCGTTCTDGETCGGSGELCDFDVGGSRDDRHDRAWVRTDVRETGMS